MWRLTASSGGWPQLLAHSRACLRSVATAVARGGNNASASASSGGGLAPAAAAIRTSLPQQVVVRRFLSQTPRSTLLQQQQLQQQSLSQMQLQMLQQQHHRLSSLHRPLTRTFISSSSNPRTPGRWRFGLITLTLGTVTGLLLARYGLHTILTKLGVVDADGVNVAGLRDALRIPAKKRQLETTIPVQFPTTDEGEVKQVTIMVDRKALSDWVNAQITQLNVLQQQVLDRSLESVERALTLEHRLLQERVADFSNWYYGYATSYRLLGHAITSFLEHMPASVAGFSERSLSQAVQADLESYIADKYEQIVLRPAETDARVKQVLEQTVERALADVKSGLEQSNQSLVKLLQSETTHLSEDQQLLVAKSTINWTAKSKGASAAVAHSSKGPEGALLGITVALTGAMSGKVAASTLASKAFMGKIATPFVSKALPVALSAAGGPVGL